MDKVNCSRANGIVYCEVLNEFGKTYYTEYFKDGLLHGVRTSWFANGNISNRYKYKHGRLISLGENFFETGQLYNCQFYF